MTGDAIKIAGMASQWDEAYARLYKQRLQEMGFYAKVLKMTDELSWVAYSYRPFSADEAFSIVVSMFTNKQDSDSGELKNTDWPPSATAGC